MSEVVAVAPVEGVPPVVDAPPPEKAPEKVTEPPKVEAPKPKPGEFARKAAAERERVQAANASKAKEQELETLRAERAKWTQDQAAKRATYLQNPLQALLDAFPGMEPVKAFELLAEAAKNGGKAPVQAEVVQLKQELEATRKQQEEFQKQQQAAQEAAQTKARQDAEAAFRDEIAGFVEANGDEFELTKLYDQTGLVFATIDEGFKKTGKVMPIKEAAGLVEKYLESEVEKALKAKKMASRLKPVEPEKPAPKTLTNDLAAQGGTRGPALTEAERMARAMAALDGLA